MLALHRAPALRSSPEARRPSPGAHARRDRARGRARRGGRAAASPQPTPAGRVELGTAPGASGSLRSKPAKCSGSRYSKNGAASRCARTILLASARRPACARPSAISELSWGQTVPLWYSTASNAGSSAASVRTPHPDQSGPDVSRCATCATRSSGTIPLHNRWPMFDASASTGRLSRSRPSAYQPRSSSQNTSLNRSRNSPASRSRRAAVSSSPHTRRANSATRSFAS